MSKNNYSEEYVKEHRTFPLRNVFFLVFLFAFQILSVFSIILYEPTPKDIIESYNVMVTPRDDGALDIEYDIVWRALDEDEPLTWVTVGMANDNVGLYKDSLSSAIKSYSLDVDGDYVALRLDLTREYSGGDVVRLSFKICQYDILCKGNSGYFYEFVPGWFNSIPIEKYEFRWKKNADTVSAYGAQDDGDYYVWSGRFACGEYRKMYVMYKDDAFAGQSTVPYTPFNDSGAYNELQENKISFAVFNAVLIIAAMIGEIYMIDSFVSYNRGRGFLTGYGHRVHTYGRINPHYHSARRAHTSSSRGGGGGRGCACACACACAGGGRAGCSQKDTYAQKKEKE